MDLSPLLGTLHRLSGGRILEDAQRKTEGEMQQAVIPVVLLNTGPEAEEGTLCAYAKDWVVEKSARPMRARCTYERLKRPLPWDYDDGRRDERPVVAMLTLSWWPRPAEAEEWAARQHGRAAPTRTS